MHEQQGTPPRAARLEHLLAAQLQRDLDWHVKLYLSPTKSQWGDFPLDHDKKAQGVYPVAMKALRDQLIFYVGKPRSIAERGQGITQDVWPPDDDPYLDDQPYQSAEGDAPESEPARKLFNAVSQLFRREPELCKEWARKARKQERRGRCMDAQWEEFGQRIGNDLIANLKKCAMEVTPEEQRSRLQAAWRQDRIDGFVAQSIDRAPLGASFQYAYALQALRDLMIYEHGEPRTEHALRSTLGLLQVFEDRYFGPDSALPAGRALRDTVRTDSDALPRGFDWTQRRGLGPWLALETFLANEAPLWGFPASRQWEPEGRMTDLLRDAFAQGGDTMSSADTQSPQTDGWVVQFWALPEDEQLYRVMLALGRVGPEEQARILATALRYARDDRFAALIVEAQAWAAGSTQVDLAAVVHREIANAATVPVRAVKPEQGRADYGVGRFYFSPSARVEPDERSNTAQRPIPPLDGRTLLAFYAEMQAALVQDGWLNDVPTSPNPTEPLTMFDGAIVPRAQVVFASGERAGVLADKAVNQGREYGLLELQAGDREHGLLSRVGMTREAPTDPGMPNAEQPVRGIREGGQSRGGRR